MVAGSDRTIRAHLCRRAGAGPSDPHAPPAATPRTGNQGLPSRSLVPIPSLAWPLLNLQLLISHIPGFPGSPGSTRDLVQPGIYRLLASSSFSLFQQPGHHCTVATPRRATRLATGSGRLTKASQWAVQPHTRSTQCAALPSVQSSQARPSPGMVTPAMVAAGCLGYQHDVRTPVPSPMHFVIATLWVASAVGAATIAGDTFAPQVAPSPASGARSLRRRPPQPAIASLLALYPPPPHTHTHPLSLNVTHKFRRSACARCGIGRRRVGGSLGEGVTQRQNPERTTGVSARCDVLRK